MRTALCGTEISSGKMLPVSNSPKQAALLLFWALWSGWGQDCLLSWPMHPKSRPSFTPSLPRGNAPTIQAPPSHSHAVGFPQMQRSQEPASKASFIAMSSRGQRGLQNHQATGLRQPGNKVSHSINVGHFQPIGHTTHWPSGLSRCLKFLKLPIFLSPKPFCSSREPGEPQGGSLGAPHLGGELGTRAQYGRTLGARKCTCFRDSFRSDFSLRGEDSSFKIKVVEFSPKCVP